MVEIRKATPQDAEKIYAIVESGRAFLQAQGLSQWQDGHDPSQRVEQDIATQRGYVLLSPEGAPCGYAALIAGRDDAYEQIQEGSWDNAHETYVAIHSVAIDAAFRGKNLADPFLRGLIAIAEGMGYRDIRIDTHPRNVIMQKVIARAGFAYRGMVAFAIPDGQRKAYQFIRA